MRIKSEKVLIVRFTLGIESKKSQKYESQKCEFISCNFDFFFFRIARYKLATVIFKLTNGRYKLQFWEKSEFWEGITQSWQNICEISRNYLLFYFYSVVGTGFHKSIWNLKICLFFYYLFVALKIWFGRSHVSITPQIAQIEIENMANGNTNFTKSPIYHKKGFFTLKWCGYSGLFKKIIYHQTAKETVLVTRSSQPQDETKLTWLQVWWVCMFFLENTIWNLNPTDFHYD